MQLLHLSFLGNARQSRRKEYHDAQDYDVQVAQGLVLLEYLTTVLATFFVYALRRAYLQDFSTSADLYSLAGPYLLQLPAGSVLEGLQTSL